jgi:membrane protease YdiL (CAAX protease family)
MRPLVRFVSLTYAATWTLFLAAIALSHRAPAVPRLLVFLGAMAPALVALAIAGARPLLDRLAQWRVAARWYAFAAFYMAGVRLAVAMAHRTTTGLWPRFDAQPLGAILTAVVVSTPFQAGEEIGWRGFALPRLAERFGWPRGSVLLGLIWACWHIPLFFLKVPGNDEYGQSFPIWALGVTALSVAMAWLYLRARGSLLLMMLMHSAVNSTPHFAPGSGADSSSIFSLHGSPTAGLTTLFLSIMAGWFLLRMEPSELAG